MPEEGGFNVILNSREEAVCITRTTKVYVTSFREVSAEHAWKEGEGDRTLEYWRTVHERFFREELETAGLPFDWDLKVVCEEFTKVFP